jgi:Reverse transcriptase (RNA-dependent DNA polymerase)
MNKIFQKQRRKSVVVYLDDIMIFSKTWEEHMKHLKKVLEILRKEKFLVKRKKCTFGVHSRKETSEDGFRKSRGSKQITSTKKSKRS